MVTEPIPSATTMYPHLARRGYTKREHEPGCLGEVCGPEHRQQPVEGILRSAGVAGGLRHGRRGQHGVRAGERVDGALDDPAVFDVLRDEALGSGA